MKIRVLLVDDEEDFVETAIEGMKLGAFDFLTKPTETEELLEKITRALGRKSEQDRRIQETEIDQIVKRRGWLLPFRSSIRWVGLREQRPDPACPR